MKPNGRRYKRKPTISQFEMISFLCAKLDIEEIKVDTEAEAMFIIDDLMHKEKSVRPE